MSPTEQQRVLKAACALEALAYVNGNRLLRLALDADPQRVEANAVAELTGLPLAVVNAAVDNLIAEGMAQE